MSDNPQTNATNRYHKKAYDRINLLVKKGQKDEIKKYAEGAGKSLNKYITDLIYEDMKKKK
ncbi:MAG: antitoxin [Eubacterium sp.]|nr:antitoxin [Eubacterium sp.]